MVIDFENFKEFKITRKDKGKHVGSVYLSNGYTWILRVGRNGTTNSNDRFVEEMEKRHGIPKAEAIANLQEITQEFKKLLSDPAKYIGEYGKHTGTCCICRLKLSDPRSLAAGYGATCAKNLGLPY